MTVSRKIIYSMSERDRKLTEHEKEQLVFSDMQLDATSGKDFKQIAMKNHQDQISGIENEEQREKSDMLSSFAQMARDHLNRMQERLAIRLNGLSVSSETARQTAGFFLDNFDMVADQLNMPTENRADNRNDLWLLENGTEIQQQEAFDRIQERSPELAEAYTEVAREIQNDPNFDPSSQFDFSSTDTDISPTPESDASPSFATLQMR